MDFNQAISPLERPRTADGFADALTIARLCSLDQPTLQISTHHGLNFESGHAALGSHKSVTISTSRESLSSRALIAVLTSLDAGAVTPLAPGVEDQIEKLKDGIWKLSELRGDYQYLLEQDAEIAGLVGLYIGAAERSVVVVIDGIDAYAAALLAQRIAFRSMDRVLAAAPSLDPAIREAELRLRLPQILATRVAKNAAGVALAHLDTTLKLTQ